MREWIYEVLIGIDQLVNAICGGYADETISSRCYRENDRQPWKALEKVVNWMYSKLQGPDHCRRAYIKELTGRQLPPGFHDREVEAETNKPA